MQAVALHGGVDNSSSKCVLFISTHISVWQAQLQLSYLLNIGWIDGKAQGKYSTRNVLGRANVVFVDVPSTDWKVELEQDWILWNRIIKHSCHHL